MLEPGQLVLDRYVIDAFVAEGGMGRVYRAHEADGGQEVALKVLYSVGDGRMRARFERESRLTGSIRHRNIVTAFDRGELDDGTPVLVFEFVRGAPLGTIVLRGGAIDWRDVAKVGVAILRALTAIHAAGVVHRDLKPSNVMLVPGDATATKVIDFGVARALDGAEERLTRTGAVVGTPYYLSPEQLVGGAVDERSDLYSVGLILYESVAGQLPFLGKGMKAMIERMGHGLDPLFAPVGLPAVPASLVAFVDHVTRPFPEERPRTARAAADALEALLASDGGDAAATRTWTADTNRRVLESTDAPSSPAMAPTELDLSNDGGLDTWKPAWELAARRRVDASGPWAAAGIPKPDEFDDASPTDGRRERGQAAGRPRRRDATDTGISGGVAPGRRVQTTPDLVDTQAMGPARTGATARSDAHQRAATEARAHRTIEPKKTDRD